MKTSASILGCGWLGLPLGNVLEKDSLKVKGSTTREENLERIKAFGMEAYHLDMTGSGARDSDFFQTDVVIITIPPSVRDYFKIITNTIAAIEANGVKNVIFISSTAVYPDLNRVVVEQDAQNLASPRSGIRLLEIENLFRYSKSFVSTVIRFGGLYGPGREPGRFLAGRTGIKGANAPVNLIHLDDCIGVIKAIIEKNAWGETFNGCAPQHPKKEEFYAKACKTLDLPSPDFGPEPVPYKIISSEKLIDVLDYQFQHPNPLLDY